jgi:hypothetical protein
LSLGFSEHRALERSIDLGDAQNDELQDDKNRASGASRSKDAKNGFSHNKQRL